MRGRVFLVGLLIALPTVGSAQLRPNAAWQTIRTEHFSVHFTRELEAFARRAAVGAERAYGLLASELVAPRARIDLVVADNVDYSNGYATPLPSNRIVIYAHPPAEEGSSLRFYDDWSTLVITHELAHIFHLDRTRGWWALAQRVFGRAPGFFPNLYAPAWVTEGLAVYYESRLTGSGRLASSFHRDIARAAAADHTLPDIGAVGLAHPRYPGGEGVYIYGSLLVDFMARIHGPANVRKFVEISSEQAIPFMVSRASRRAFGTSFVRAWPAWRDSLVAGADTARRLGDWRELTDDGWVASHPRWRDNATIVYAANPGKSSSGVYEIDIGADTVVRRLARRADVSPNVPLADGSLLVSQLEFRNPFDVRSDLVVARGSDERRVTRGARLIAPDVRADGEIVAEQETPGSTRLVRVSRDYQRVTPLTESSLDVQWSDPRWSRRGDRIAAIRHATDGTNAIVVLDTMGRQLAALAVMRAVNATPSWAPDDTAIVFASDREGAMNLYRVRLGRPASDGSFSATGLERLGWAGTAIYQPELSPDGTRVAAAVLRGDGLHIGVATIASLPVTDASSARGVVPPAAEANRRVTLAADTIAVKKYSPWRSLRPRYWLPIVAQSDSARTEFGAYTSGSDIVGRHSYYAEASYEPKRRDISSAVRYQYAGLGQPFLTLGGDVFHDYRDVADSAGSRLLGDLGRHCHVASLAATFVRRRVRTGASASIGADYEWRTFETSPDTLIRSLPAIYSQTLQYPAFSAGVAWANVQRPITLISAEDGIALSASARHRWRRQYTPSDTSTTRTLSVLGVARGYKSIDLGGFAHHVLAGRVAGAFADRRAITEFTAGGGSGSTIELIPGVNVGEAARTFGVRGFPAAAQRGTNAIAATVEYRAPLALIARGVPLLPIALNRASVSLFGEGARAWCQPGVVDRSLCVPLRVTHETMASVGAELAIDTAIQYDAPYRFRFGVAVPVRGYSTFAERRVSAYVLFGSAF